MDKLTIVFTKDLWSPISWLIRWTLPRSRFSLALSSHCYIQDGNDFYQVLPFKGVHVVTETEMLMKDKVVCKLEYQVPNRNKSIEFLKSQLGKGYDYKAAIALGLRPGRDWDDDNKWFCYELAGAALMHGGREEFNNVFHVNEIVLMSIKSNLIKT